MDGADRKAMKRIKQEKKKDVCYFIISRTAKGMENRPTVHLTCIGIIDKSGTSLFSNYKG
jgi:hypothetical protein